jgi:acyl-coenzyme A synthetase/AMP-(fatty) acid ligase
MLIKLLCDDKSVQEIELDGANSAYCKDKLSALVSSKSKIDAYKELFFCETHDITAVCFDSSMTTIANKCSQLGITTLDNATRGSNFGDTKTIFFTSGTTATPRGALKTKAMLTLEATAQLDYLSKYDFNSLLITVPLYHIYGYLFGYEIAKLAGCDIYTKELFMPQNIMDFTASNRSACVTTPVFLKAMLKMSERIDLSSSLFISSTGAMNESEVGAFYEKFGAEIIQIYGSTETGGVATRERNSKFWTPLDGVTFETDINLRLSVSSPYVSKEIFEDELSNLPGLLQTSDIVRLHDVGFEIVGRSFELLKIGGKRVSVLEIEAKLEENSQISEAQVKPVTLEGLKDEQVEIFAVTTLSDKELVLFVSKTLKELYSEIKINAKCYKVISLEKTFNGKKIRQ